MAGPLSGYSRHHHSDIRDPGVCWAMWKMHAVAQCVWMYKLLYRPLGGCSAVEQIKVRVQHCSILTAPQKVLNRPLSNVIFMVDFYSDPCRFICSCGVMDVTLGITIAAPTSSGLALTKEAYGSLIQLVVLCDRGSKLEAYEWEELSTVLSDVMHPLVVDILSDEGFGEDTEASIQARIPTAVVHLHSIHCANHLTLSRVILEEFWERGHDPRATAGPAGS